MAIGLGSLDLSLIFAELFHTFAAGNNIVLGVTGADC